VQFSRTIRAAIEKLIMELDNLYDQIALIKAVGDTQGFTAEKLSCN
jgi:hypothetical protein